MPSSEADLIQDFGKMEACPKAQEAWLEAFVFVLDQGRPLFLSWAAFHYEVSKRTASMSKDFSDLIRPGDSVYAVKNKEKGMAGHRYLAGAVIAACAIQPQALDVEINGLDAFSLREAAMLEGAAGVWARHFSAVNATIVVNASLSTDPPTPLTLGLLSFASSLMGPHTLQMFVRDDRFWNVAVHEMGHAMGYGHPRSHCGPAVAAIWTGACPLSNTHSVFPNQVMSSVTTDHPKLNPVSIAIIAGECRGAKPVLCASAELCIRHPRLVLAPLQCQLPLDLHRFALRVPSF